jgi:hypothetical protein
MWARLAQGERRETATTGGSGKFLFCLSYKHTRTQGPSTSFLFFSNYTNTHAATEDIPNNSHNRLIDVHGRNRALVEVDGEPGGRRKVIEDFFEVRNMLKNSANDDESVINVLKDRTEEVVYERVEEEPLPRDNATSYRGQLWNVVVAREFRRAGAARSVAPTSTAS